MKINDNIINTIKKSIGRTDTSNCTLYFDDIIKGIDENRYFVIETNPLLLIKQNNEYNQLFYFIDKEHPLDTPENIDEQLKRFDVVYSDITIKNGFHFEGSVFQLLNMTPFKIYQRKSFLNTGKHFRELLQPEFAKESCLYDIYQLLSETFNSMSDHIPDKDELSRLIADNNVLCIYIQNKIAGVLLFENTGIKSYARSLCVSTSFQNGAIGYSLLAKYINLYTDTKIKQFYLWVDTANDSVMKLHDNFGYKADGLYNYIFIRGGKDQ